jgi:hypothetical protein
MALGWRVTGASAMMGGLEGATVSTVGSQVVGQFELTYLSSSGKGIERFVELAIELQGRFQCDGKSHENHSAKR